MSIACLLMLADVKTHHQCYDGSKPTEFNFHAMQPGVCAFVLDRLPDLHDNPLALASTCNILSELLKLKFGAAQPVKYPRPWLASTYDPLRELLGLDVMTVRPPEQLSH
jgi:hypothetical protein